LTKYEIVAPISGTIIERHASLGESVSTDKELFILADPSAVWVDVTVYPRDLALVRAGQSLSIDLGDGNPIPAKIGFVTPQVREETRTGVARVIMENAEGRLKPGMFLKAQIEIADQIAAVRVPKSAVQTDEQHNSIVFVQSGNKFEPRPVQLGNQNTNFVEIESGLKAGESYVSKGAFTLKAELAKGSFAEED
jgi:cobalt-zinc-cadmium efflux system membrane fusion protein